MDPLQALLELQKVDTVRDRLEERKEHLPEKDELADLESRMNEVRARIERVQTEADAVGREISRIDLEVKTLDEKIAQEEAKLYGGSVVNPKELSALQSEIEMFKRRKTPLEEGELEQMVVRDELTAERDGLEAELADLEKETTVVRERIGAATGEIERELGVEDTRRDQLLGVIPLEVLEEYESLRGQKKGVGVGALEGGSCTACREALSAVEIDRLKRRAREGERLDRCEHCRRLLVVP